MIDDFNGQYRFLSNFAWSDFIWYSRRFGPQRVRTVEHAYQAEKALRHQAFYDVLATPTPGTAKRAGRRIEIRPDWEEVKFPIMRRALDAKFRSSFALTDLLLATGDEQLVEGNTWHDNIWGDCHCNKRVDCDLPGENHLGRMLMDLRDNWYAE